MMKQVWKSSLLSLLMGLFVMLSIVAPSHARFLTPDTWDPEIEGVDISRYAYGLNDPINNSDSNGHCASPTPMGESCGPFGTLQTLLPGTTAPFVTNPIGGSAEGQIRYGNEVNRIRTIAATGMAADAGAKLVVVGGGQAIIGGTRLALSGGQSAYRVTAASIARGREVLNRASRAVQAELRKFDIEGEAPGFRNYGLGRIFQLRYNGNRLIVRLDYKELSRVGSAGGQGPARLHMNIQYGGRNIHVRLDPRSAFSSNGNGGIGGWLRSIFSSISNSGRRRP